MTPDVFAVSFEGGVRAAIQTECPNCDGTGQLRHYGDGTVCHSCDGSWRVSALSTVTLPESPLHLDLQRSGPLSLPFTLGLVLGDWDAGAAARIEADTGWAVRRIPARPPKAEAVLISDGDKVRFLPVGRLVATARVWNVHPATALPPDCLADCPDQPGIQYGDGLWHWRLSGVAVVDDPSQVTAPDGKAVWTP